MQVNPRSAELVPNLSLACLKPSFPLPVTQNHLKSPLNHPGARTCNLSYLFLASPPPCLVFSNLSSTLTHSRWVIHSAWFSLRLSSSLLTKGVTVHDYSLPTNSFQRKGLHGPGITGSPFPLSLQGPPLTLVKTMAHFIYLILATEYRNLSETQRTSLHYWCKGSVLYNNMYI